MERGVKGLLVERRNYVRVEGTLALHMEILDPSEVPQQAREISSSSDDRSAALLRSYVKRAESGDANVQAAMIKLLVSIDHKLDMLLEQNSGQKRKVDSVLLKNTRANVSGSGIRFPVTKALACGDSVKLTLLLPLSPPSKIVTLARVVRVEDAKPGADGAKVYDTAFQFIGMSQGAREEVIRYVTQRQREVFREQAHRRRRDERRGG